MNGVRNADNDWLVLTGNVYQVTGWLVTPQVMLTHEAMLEHLRQLGGVRNAAHLKGKDVVSQSKNKRTRLRQTLEIERKC
jgi:hypothetical protein